jgi:hypothetical protein
MDGQPLVRARIMFRPTEPKGTGELAALQSAGVTNEAGEYKLVTIDHGPGAVVGMHQVSITKPTSPADEVKSAASDYSGVAADMAVDPTKISAFEPIPERYNTKSELTFEVPSGGSTEANFDIKSK